MTEFISIAQRNVYDREGVLDDVELESYNLVAYSVQGDVIVVPAFGSVPNHLKDVQKDSAQQNETWKIFTDLIPPCARLMVAQYNVFTDGYSNTLAAVDQTKEFRIRTWIHDTMVSLQKILKRIPDDAKNKDRHCQFCVSNHCNRLLHTIG